MYDWRTCFELPSPYFWQVSVEGLAIHICFTGFYECVNCSYMYIDRLHNKKHSVQHSLWNEPSRSASRRLSRPKERQKLPKWYPLQCKCILYFLQRWSAVAFYSYCAGRRLVRYNLVWSCGLYAMFCRPVRWCLILPGIIIECILLFIVYAAVLSVDQIV